MHLVIGPTKSFKILITDGATSRHLYSFHALYESIMLLVASIPAFSETRIDIEPQFLVITWHL